MGGGWWLVAGGWWLVAGGWWGEDGVCGGGEGVVRAWPGDVSLPSTVTMSPNLAVSYSSETRLLSPRGKRLDTTNRQPMPARHGCWRHNPRLCVSRPPKLGAYVRMPIISSVAFAGCRLCTPHRSVDPVFSAPRRHPPPTRARSTTSRELVPHLKQRRFPPQELALRGQPRPAGGLYRAPLDSEALGTPG